MKPGVIPFPGGFHGYRVKLMLVMMLLVAGITGAGLYFAERNLAESVAGSLQREFQGELAALHGIQELRHATFAELCRTLVRKPRIHAALEDNALDLLYPIAKDELRDVMTPGNSTAPKTALEAVFYRFLDLNGTVIPPKSEFEAGPLRSVDERQLSLQRLPREHQIGYLVSQATDGGETLAEIIAMLRYGRPWVPTRQARPRCRRPCFPAWPTLPTYGEL